MAIVAVVLGGLFGFANFLAALLVYDASFLAALGIYSASGICFAICILLLTLAIRTALPGGEAQRTAAHLRHRQQASPHRF